MKKSILLKVSLAALFCIVSVSCVSSQLIFKKGAPRVKIDQGSFVGRVKKSRGDQMYYEFLGLRYANPPKRFQPPEPYVNDNVDASGRQEVQQAVTPPPKCPQQFGQELTGSEDCLFLNVNIPMRTPPNEGFPVLVWIHGGAFTFGHGNGYDPKYFMDEDVIVVTINYRLGAFGFLSTEDDLVPGNMGLKDQTMALRWVQENIKFFNGDKTRVTIMGASSVHYLILSPIAKGLFHSAIAQSGSVHNFWAFAPKPRDAAFELGQLLKCDTETSQTLVKCLQEKTVLEIISAQAIMKRWYIDPIAPFAPNVELNHVTDASAFLPDHPDKIIERREFSKVPLLVGINKDEGLSMNAVGVINNEKLTNQINLDFETIAPITFNFRNWFSPTVIKELCKELRSYYFGDKPIHKDTLQNLTNLYSDVNFVYGVWKFALEHSTEQPVYPYLLTFQDESSFSLTKLFSGTDTKYGVAHGDDIQYLFASTIFAEEVPKDSEAEKFSKRLVKLWVSFATHRKPTEVWGSAAGWPPISKAQLQGDKPFTWFQLDQDTSIVENPFLVRKKFWDKIFKKYNKNVKDEL